MVSQNKILIRSVIGKVDFWSHQILQDDTKRKMGQETSDVDLDSIRSAAQSSKGCLFGVKIVIYRYLRSQRKLRDRSLHFSMQNFESFRLVKLPSDFGRCLLPISRANEFFAWHINSSTIQLCCLDGIGQFLNRFSEIETISKIRENDNQNKTKNSGPCFAFAGFGN